MDNCPLPLELARFEHELIKRHVDGLTRECALDLMTILLRAENTHA
jgi:hypothetical protein